jgi:hypothetical protein
MTDARACTCHPDEAPVPCQRGYALSVCKAREALRERVATICGGNYIAADAAIAVALEEAAKVAKKQLDYTAQRPNGVLSRSIAAAIRGLISSTTQS